MAKSLDVLLGSHFVGWDTSPSPTAPITFAWPSDFPPSYQDSEKAVLISGVSVVLTASGLGVARRVFLSLQGPGPAFVEWARIPAVATVSLSATRRVEFQVGQQTGTAGTTLREVLPGALRLLPGHRIVVDVEDRNAGDAVTFVSIRGSILAGGS